MIYTASDAIDLVYRVIGKISATTVSAKQDLTHMRLMAMDIKEFYRSLTKLKIKTEDEFLNKFNSYDWTFITNAEDKGLLGDLSKFMLDNFFMENDENYFLDRVHVRDELKKIYDLALESTFLNDKSLIDYNKSVRIIESRFLTFLNEMNIKFDSEFKKRLKELVASFNKKEDVNYEMKYKTVLESIETYKEFIKKYESDESLKNLPNFTENYNQYKGMIKSIDKLTDGRPDFFDYKSLVKAINDLPEDAEKIPFNEGVVLCERLFYVWFINKHISSNNTINANPKFTMLRENGGLMIDFNKPEVINMYVALTQNKKVIKEKIKFNGRQLNLNIVDVCSRLISLSLSSVAPEKFVNVENNEEFEIPNKIVISLFIEELTKLINYHELGGVTDTKVSESNRLPANPKQKNIAASIANDLLDFENISGVIIALKSGHNEIKDFPDAVVLRTVKYISKLGEIEIL